MSPRAHPSGTCFSLPQNVPLTRGRKKELSMKRFLPLLPWGAAALPWALWSNKALSLHQLSLTLPRLPAPFAGLRIAQVSDLHNAHFGPENRALTSLLAGARPHLVVLTGDLVDARRPRPDRALAFATQAAAIAPTYYVPGNHEARLPQAQYRLLEDGLRQAGVTVLFHRKEVLTRQGAQLTLLGLADHGFGKKKGAADSPAARTAAALAHLCQGETTCSILLLHRPDFFLLCAAQGIDLVLSGHTHGGQVRLPGLGGLFGPDQGLFPLYDGGVYRRGASQMVVSRGLGNSLAPLRINNRPELVLLTLSPPAPVSGG